MVGIYEVPLYKTEWRLEIPVLGSWGDIKPQQEEEDKVSCYEAMEAAIALVIIVMCLPFLYDVIFHQEHP